MSDLSFTLVQSSLHWEDTWANLQMFGQKMEAINTPTHVVVLPEMFSTGFSMKPEALALESYAQSLSWMKEMARKKKLIITGSVMAAEEDRYHNRMVWMQPDGAFGYYDKRHLFAYAGEHEHFAPGNQRLIASVNGWKVHLLVCYDLRFPVWARQQYGEDGSFEYDVLVYVANWPERRNTAWKTLLQARAIENQCYVIGVNRVGTDGNDIYYSGDSMVVDPLGEILYQKAHEEDVFTISLSRPHLQAVREKLPFWRDADRFSIYP